MSEQKIFVYLRTSDKGNKKDKIATREECLKNAIAVFGKENIQLIADNCNEDTIHWLETLGVRYIMTKKGNAGSFVWVMNKIIRERAADDIVYLLEDDYLHLPEAKGAMIEGLKIADYVTLYDHNAYYTWPLFMRRGGDNTRLYIDGKYHFRKSYYTTMTFATTVKTLKKDKQIFEKYCNRKIPDDFPIWFELTMDSVYNVIKLLQFCIKEKRWRERSKAAIRGLFKKDKRLLLNVVPGLSTHTEPEWLAPGIDWKSCCK